MDVTEYKLDESSVTVGGKKIGATDIIKVDKIFLQDFVKCKLRYAVFLYFYKNNKK